MVKKTKKSGKKRDQRERIVTFTYFIPGPKAQKSLGHQEKNFDQQVARLIKSGYRPISLTPCPHHDPKCPGVWVFLVLETTKSEESDGSADGSMPELIDGIYYESDVDSFIHDIQEITTKKIDRSDYDYEK